MRHAICYVSNCSEELNHQQIEELLKYCRDKNKSLNVKGLLLYSEKNFFQILEGERRVVLDLYKKIREDPRHYELIQVIGRDIEVGCINNYKADIIKDELNRPGVPREYIEAIQGLPLDVRKSIERMLEMFLSTRINNSGK